jgi:hypothetical protein
MYKCNRVYDETATAYGYETVLITIKVRAVFPLVLGKGTLDQ